MCALERTPCRLHAPAPTHAGAQPLQQRTTAAGCRGGAAPGARRWPPARPAPRQCARAPQAPCRCRRLGWVAACLGRGVEAGRRGGAGGAALHCGGGRRRCGAGIWNLASRRTVRCWRLHAGMAQCAPVPSASSSTRATSAAARAASSCCGALGAGGSAAPATLGRGASRIPAGARGARGGPHAARTPRPVIRDCCMAAVRCWELTQEGSDDDFKCSGHAPSFSLSCPDNWRMRSADVGMALWCH